MSKGDWLGYVGKRVIVSGCYSGIGYAAARQLIELGAQVHGFDRKTCDLDLAAFTLVDLRERESIEASIAALGGRYDALFNCAGIPPGAPPMVVMKVNYIGTRHLTEGILPLLAAGGAIVNIASTGGMGWQQRLPDLLDLIAADDFEAGLNWCAVHADMMAEGYRFSKEAIIVWTMAQSSVLIRRGIRLNATLPGAVQTPMLEEIEKVTPTHVIDQTAVQIGRRSSADEQAAALLFLNSSRASYLNGAVLPVDGGFMAATTIR